MKQSKEVTIYDIAQKLHISSATVSRGLNNHFSVNRKTQKIIIETARAMGYRSNLFAKNLRHQKTRTLGIIVQTLNSNFIASVLSGIEQVANKAGYNLIISQSQESQVKEAINAEAMFNRRVDGLIVSLAFDTKNVSHFDSFFNKDIPVVFFDRISFGQSSTNVVIDNFKAGYEATRHLVSQGCKRIAHITGNLTRNVYADRMKGYKEALEESKIPFNEKYLLINNMDEVSALDAAARLMSMKLMPDGLFVANDNCAAVCMQAIKDAGYSVPKDIAIVGFNNDIISRVVNPKITTVNYPGEQMGTITANALINHLEGKANLGATSTIIIKSELIIRESSLRKNIRSAKRVSH
ncbi:LacI family transcriptional regulator [Hanamia caeni]|jgi:LacI family transcriptional regulator|uniref:LacI family transcriptional regulator n=1 Tax=Hanamia caeni TaxID=2294116 RepID=A0A3M9N713_9BACT|nr:LacI family DNA-binding transcriptional regulator [Hanamia caeni]RNI33516.1 LacI family transcriptional regulator [Hanamia caeni]